MQQRSGTSEQQPTIVVIDDDASMRRALDNLLKSVGFAVELFASPQEFLQSERPVMALVVAGRMNKQIAGELGVSEMTVKMHRRQVMRKMQAAGVAQLVRLADQLSLVAPLKC